MGTDLEKIALKIANSQVAKIENQDLDLWFSHTLKPLREAKGKAEEVLDLCQSNFSPEQEKRVLERVNDFAKKYNKTLETVSYGLTRLQKEIQDSMVLSRSK